MQYDLAGNMTRLTWSDGFYATYDHLVTGEVSIIKENGSVALATFGYDAMGRRSSLTYGNGVVTSYSYDPLSRLGGITHDIAGSTYDITLGFSYNPASQIVSNTRSNDLYAWAGPGSGSTATSVDGLNQLANVGGALRQTTQGGPDCNSPARQISNFANDVSRATGGSALLFGVLGAEPVAAGLGAVAGLADGVSFIAGGYIYLTEGDSGPLKSSFTGAALGAVARVGVGAFGGKSFSPVAGTRVNIAPSNTKLEAAEYAGGQAGAAAPAQTCR
jgi:YD repeat-containing protein